MNNARRTIIATYGEAWDAAEDKANAAVAAAMEIRSSIIAAANEAYDRAQESAYEIRSYEIDAARIVGDSAIATETMSVFPIRAAGTKRVHLGTIINGRDGRERVTQICRMGQRTSARLSEGEAVTCTTCLDAGHVARTEVA